MHSIFVLLVLEAISSIAVGKLFAPTSWVEGIFSEDEMTHSVHGIGNSFRRMESANFFPKATHDKCQCPPNEACKMEYNINEGAAEMLKIRGVIEDDEVQMYREQKKLDDNQKTISRRSISGKMECCCPPGSGVQPAFITEHKFKQYLNKLAQDGPPQ